MKKSKGNNWPPAKRSAKKRSIVRSAVLQNPLEVEASTRGCPAEQRERLRGQWILNGTISSLMFDDLRANVPNDLSAHLTAITTPSGAAYAFITCQKGVRQHRFVLPLYEPKVIEFFAAVSRQPLNLYLGSVKGGDEGFIYDCNFSHDELMPVLDIINAVSHENRGNFISELPQFLVDIVHPRFVPSQTATVVVRNVDVSMLMPMRAIQGRAYEHCLEAA